MSSPEPEEPERPESASGAGVHDFDAVELDYEAEEEDLDAAEANEATAATNDKGNDDDENGREDEEQRWLAAVAADIDEVSFRPETALIIVHPTNSTPCSFRLHVTVPVSTSLLAFWQRVMTFIHCVLHGRVMEVQIHVFIEHHCQLLVGFEGTPNAVIQYLDGQPFSIFRRCRS